MSYAQRVSILSGVLVATIACLVVFQGFFQEAGGQTEDPGAPPAGEEPSFTEPDRGDFERGKLIVKLEEDATRADLRELNRENDARTEENLPEGDVSVVDLPNDLTVREAVEVYEDSPDVEYAEPDFFIYPSQAAPEDSFYPEMYDLNNTGQNDGTPDADIDAPEAWSTETGDPGTLVAVIDEGVDVDHPDLRENIWVNEDEIPGNGIDDDDNGYVDDVNGWDFANDDDTVYDPVTDPLTGSVSGDEHGTHVAGTVAATGDNGRGVTGVNWRADVMALKFLNPDGGRLSDAVEAIDYAVANGAGISNNSWGCGGCNSQTLKDAISRSDAAGHLFVAAAGNAGVDNDDPAVASYPASYDNPNIISVAATNDDDGLAGFSNVGGNTVDLGAPGVNILSTLPGNKYAYYSGTSMASPHVAGVAALIQSQNPTLNDGQIKARIMESVEKKTSLSSKTVTGGRVNAAQALGVTLATNLSLNANPLALTFGQGITLSGRLTSGGDALGGRTVILEQRPLGATTFSRFGQATTRSDGNFSLGGVKPTKHTDYRARFAGSSADQLRPSVSTARRVNVRVLVTLNTQATNLKLGKGRAISGAVRPLHGGAATVTIKRNGSVIANRKVALNDSSQYRFVYKPPSPGTYAFSATYPKDTDHLGNRSPQRSFKVVR